MRRKEAQAAKPQRARVAVRLLHEQQAGTTSPFAAVDGYVPVRTRHCAASTRDSCGASGLEWPVFRTASGCAADELPYSRSCAGALCAFADVPALFELRAVGRAGGAAAAAFPRVPAP